MARHHCGTRLVKWAAARCAPYRLPVPVQIGAIGIDSNAAPWPAETIRTERVFSQLETLQLMAANFLSAADLDDYQPQIYTEMKS
jgi:hypothetical protein